MSTKYQISAIIPGENTIVVLKFIEGVNPVNTLILGSVVEVSFGEPEKQEEPEFNR